MKRVLRFGIPLLVVVATAAAAVGGVLLVTHPWQDEEATAASIEYRLCDVVLKAPPRPRPPDDRSGQWIAVVRVFVRTGPGQLEPELLLRMKGEPVPTDPATGKTKTSPSVVSIDPKTGAPLLEHYATLAADAAIKGVLDTALVAQLDPSTAPWPYTDRRQMTFEREKSGAFEYLRPDPGSGIVVIAGRGSGIDSFSHSITAANCRSIVEITAVFRDGREPDVTTTSNVDPEDEAAFQRFLDEVKVIGLEP